MSGKSKLTPLIVLVVVFAVGALAGVGGTLQYMDGKRAERRAKWMAEEEKERSLTGIDRFLYRIGRDLQMSEAQVAAIKADVAFMSSFEEVRGLNDEFRPKIREVFDRRMDALKSHLTEEQVEKMSRIRERMRRGDWGRGGHGGHGGHHQRSGEKRDGEKKS
ncbi:MAG: hypothetical protein AAGB46_04700 [Verrucomicrobiota bacterium]